MVYFQAYNYDPDTLIHMLKGNVINPTKIKGRRILLISWGRYWIEGERSSRVRKYSALTRTSGSSTISGTPI